MLLRARERGLQRFENVEAGTLRRDRDKALIKRSDSQPTVVDEHRVAPPTSLLVRQARPLARGGVVELNAGQVL